MATTDYRFAIQLQFVNDNLTDNADTLLIGDFTDKYVADDAKSNQFEFNNSRLLFVKDRHGSKVVTATDLLNKLKRFVANFLEVNTKSTYVTDPKVTFIVQTNDNHNMLTEEVIEGFHKEINENIDKFKPYILNVSTDGMDYEVIPYATAGVVFTTMTIRTGVTAGNLAYLIKQLFEFVEKENVALINEYNTWFEKIYTQIENEAKQIVSNDKDLTDITTSVIAYETYRQVIENWYDVAVEYYNNKPSTYIIDTRGVDRNTYVAYRIYSSAGDNEKPVLNVHMMATPSMTSGIIANYEAHMEITRYGTMLKCTEGTSTLRSPKPIPYLNDNGSTLRVPGNSLYRLVADTPYLKFHIAAYEKCYYWQSTNAGTTGVNRSGSIALQSFGQMYYKHPENSLACIDIYPAYGTSLANNYAQGYRGHSYKFYPNFKDGYMYMHSAETGSYKMNKLRSSLKSGVMNLRFYDTENKTYKYVPLHTKQPAEATLRVVDGYSGKINYLNKYMITPQYEDHGYGMFTGYNAEQNTERNSISQTNGRAEKGWEFGRVKEILHIPFETGMYDDGGNYRCVANVRIRYVHGPYVSFSPRYCDAKKDSACRVTECGYYTYRPCYT